MPIMGREKRFTKKNYQILAGIPFSRAQISVRITILSVTYLRKTWMYFLGQPYADFVGKMKSVT